MAVVALDPKLDRALTAFERLARENPEAIDELVTFLMARPHTGSATFRIRGHRVVCIETQKVSGYGATKDPA